MGGRTWITILACALAGACDRKPAAQPIAASAPATEPVAATLPAIKPVERVAAVFVITPPGMPDQPIQFPPAKLVLQQIDDDIRASLFSNDPPEALKAGYTGNSFYFDMQFSAKTIADIPGAEFKIRNSASDENEDNKGLYILGDKQVLKPVSVDIRIDGEPGSLSAIVSGTFQLYDENTKDGILPQSVNVNAKLLPEVIEKK